MRLHGPQVTYLLINEEGVESLVNRLVIMRLHGTQVRLHERQLFYLQEEADSSSMVHSRSQHNQKVVQQKRFVVQVELKGLVVQFDVGHFGDHFFE